MTEADVRIVVRRAFRECKTNEPFEVFGHKVEIRDNEYNIDRQYFKVIVDGETIVKRCCAKNAGRFIYEHLKGSRG